MKKNTFNLKLFMPLLGLIFPLITSAAFFSQTKNLIGDVKDIVDLLIPIVAALALLYFFWGLAKFILHADNEDKRAEGKQVMMWGIIALFVMVSIWGIVDFIAGELLNGADTGPFDPNGLIDSQPDSNYPAGSTDLDPSFCPGGGANC